MVRSIRRILVPVDFSEHSARALSYAAFLADPMGATLDVLHVWQPPSYVPIETALTTVGTGAPQTLAEVARLEASRDMTRLTEQLSKSGTEVTTSHVEAGEPVEVIVRHATAGNYDLVVMGTHGRTGFRHLILGSVAERVMRRAPCPVLTLRGLSNE